MKFRDLPTDVLYEIAKTVPKKKLGEIATLSYWSWSLLSYPPLWKNTVITYPRDRALAFEDLFTGPCPIKTISLAKCTVKLPKERYAGGMRTTVATLILSKINADVRTIIAILTKYETKCLVLNGVHITGSIAKAIAKMACLESLCMRNDAINLVNRPSAFIKILKKCTRLKELDLCGKDITEDALDQICANMPVSLETLLLNLRHRTMKNKHLMALLKKCPNLTKLGIPAYLLGSRTLSKFRRIDTLFLSGWNHRFFHTERYLSAISNLRHVYLLLKCDYLWLNGEVEVTVLQERMIRSNVDVELKPVITEYNEYEESHEI